MKVAVLGAGAGGAATAVELTAAGHEVRLWNRSLETIRPFVDNGIGYEGVLGEGRISLDVITDDLSKVIVGADLAVVVLPTLLHAAIAKALVDAGWQNAPVILNPGHTGGALEFNAVYRRESGGRTLPIAELASLTYIARKYAPDKVTVTGRAKKLRGAALPGGMAALEAAMELFPGVYGAPDVLASDLSNLNMVLHPPGAILAAAWIEARPAQFTFYVDAMTPAVERTMRLLDEERMAVAKAFGHELPNIIEDMRAVGSVPAGTPADAYAEAIASGEANRNIKAPDSVGHRYYTEDFGYGLTPFLAFARIAEVATPVSDALSKLGEVACGISAESGRTARAMGIEGLSRSELLKMVRG